MQIFYDEEDGVWIRPTIVPVGLVVDENNDPVLNSAGKKDYRNLKDPELRKEVFLLYHGLGTKEKAKKSNKCKDCRRCHMGLAGLCCDRIRAIVPSDSGEADPEPDLDLDDPEPEI